MLYGRGPADQSTLFSKMQNDLNSDLYQTVMSEVMQPTQEAVTSMIINGAAMVGDEFNPVEKRQKVFGFISSETR